MTHIPILSICIPTYNRASFLQELIASIESQLGGVPVGSVEIVVSDNASTDNTEELIAAYRRKGAEIKYLRHDKNLGMDANYLSAINMAAGEYCWLMGDDDLISDGGIHVMLELIGGSYSLIVANARAYDVRMQSPTGMVYLGGKHADCNDAFLAIGPWISFISSMCFPRLAFLNQSDLYLSKMKTLIAFCYVILRMIKTGGVVITDVEIVKYRSGNTGGYNLYNVFVVEVERLLTFAVAEGYDQHSINYVRNAFMTRVIIPCTVQYRLSEKKLPPLWESITIIFRSRVGVFMKLYVIGIRLAPTTLLQAIKFLKGVWRQRSMSC